MFYLVDKIIKFGLQQLVNEPTRSHNILDVFFLQNLFLKKMYWFHLNSHLVIIIL